MYAEFWKQTASGAIMPCVGSDSILFFDGRWSLNHRIMEARKVCFSRNLYGFTIRSGPMNRPHDREICPLEIVAEDNPPA